jgi:phosphatidylinositol-3-phosphatase
MLIAAVAASGIGVAVTSADAKVKHAKAKHSVRHHQHHHAQATHGPRQYPGTSRLTIRAAQATPKPCGSLAGRPSKVSHVIWVVLENRSYSQVMGAPYIRSLASQCGVATNYHNVSHPSLPNYIAMTSGQAMGHLPLTDCPTFCPVAGPSIFTQTSSWHVYAESMPGHCVRHDARPYVVHHTAAPYYSAVTNCGANDVPLTELNMSALSRFSMIVPNLAHDMHEGSSSVAAGDAWLRAQMGAILSSSTYRAGGTVVFVTWDEGGTPRTTNNCAHNTTDQGCHVALLVASPHIIPGARWTMLANHYTLLRVTEQLLGLPYLGQAAATASIKSSLGL